MLKKHLQVKQYTAGTRNKKYEARNKKMKKLNVKVKYNKGRKSSTYKASKEVKRQKQLNHLQKQQQSRDTQSDDIKYDIKKSYQNQ